MQKFFIIFFNLHFVEFILQNKITDWINLKSQDLSPKKSFIKSKNKFIFWNLLLASYYVFLL